MTRRSRGLALGELVFMLFISGVLLALIISIKIEMSRPPIPPRRELTAEARTYLRGLGFVSGEASGPEESAEIPPPAVSRVPRRTPDNLEATSKATPPPPAHQEMSRFSPSASLVASSSRETPTSPDNLVTINVPEHMDEPSAASPATAAGGGELPGGLIAVGNQGKTTASEAVSGAATDSPSGSSAATVLLGLPNQRASSVNMQAVASDALGAKPGAPMRKPRTLYYRPRGPDVWTHWPDANQRRIGGLRGVMRLTRALQTLEQSGAKGILEDLERKGIAVSFGDPAEFRQAGEHAAALLLYAATDRPPFSPKDVPAIKINPKYADEDARVLAAVLVHEGTHFQQYLDGTVISPAASTRDAEADAWVNGAAFWQETRNAEGLPRWSDLARQEELSFQVARQGEGPLRDLLAALYPLMR